MTEVDDVKTLNNSDEPPPPNEADSVQKKLLDEIDADDDCVEKNTEEKQQNWRGTLTKILKSNPFHETGDGNESMMSNAFRKTSSLGKMFRRGKDDNETKHGDKEKSPKSRPKVISKLLKKWPFNKTESSTSTASADVPSSTVSATVDY